MDLSSLVITPEMLSLLTDIDEFKGAWKLYSRLTPERLQQLKTVATIESIGSSTRIEGSKLSDREVERLLSNLEERSFVSRDEQEVAGYAYVCEEIFQSFTYMGFTENLLKQLHGWLLKFSDKDEHHRGKYKILSNNIEAFNAEGKSLGIVFETASPFETPRKMEELIFWTNSQLEQRQIHPLIVIGMFVVAFLAIHPFQDGNGRLSRILTTLLLLKSGYHYVPYSSLESIIEKNKESYYLALRRTQGSLKSASPDLASWLLFFLRALQKQKIHLEKKVAREKDFLTHFSELDGKVLNLVAEHGRLNIAELETLTKANRNTLKKHLAALVEAGQLLRQGKGKATWYTVQ